MLVFPRPLLIVGCINTSDREVRSALEASTSYLLICDTHLLVSSTRTSLATFVCHRRFLSWCPWRHRQAYA